MDSKFDLNYNMMLKAAGDTSDHHERVDEFQPGLIRGLADTDPKYAALEIGHRNGGSTLLIGWHLWKEGKRRLFVSVDFQEQEQWWTFYANVLPYFKAWDIPWVYYLMDQNEFTEKYAGQYEFGFIYHDGAHEAKKVIPDLERLALRLTPGGVMAVDDIHVWTSWQQAPTFGIEKASIETWDVGDHRGIDSNHIGFWRRPK